MIRFGLLVCVYTLGATVTWWWTADLTAGWCIRLAKSLHYLAGYPAPYLIADVLGYFWFAPPVQLLVGLMLASWWLSWRRRVGLLIAGIACQWFIVALAVIALASPYLGQGLARVVVDKILTKDHTLVTPTVFWLLLAGPPPLALLLGGSKWWWGSAGSKPVEQRNQVGRHGRRMPDGRDHRRAPAGGRVWNRRGSAESSPGSYGRHWLFHLAMAGGLCVLVAGVLLIIEASAPSDIRDARRELAHSIRIGRIELSMRNASVLGKLQAEHYKSEESDTVRKDAQLYYLLGRLCQAARQFDLARKFLLTRALSDAKTKAKVSRELREAEAAIGPP